MPNYLIFISELSGQRAGRATPRTWGGCPIAARPRLRAVGLALAAVTAAIVVAPRTWAEAPTLAPYHVAATVGMVADIVRQVAGDKAVVTGIIGEGVDPHLFKPTRGDVALLLGADVIFYSGLKLEGRMADTLEKIAGRKPTFAVTQLIDPSYLHHPPQFEGHPDPHVWMDPTAWARCVDVVARALADYDPANAQTYRDNAAAYVIRCHELDAWAREVMATIPPPQRVLVTAHDAFHYFGRAYGLEVRGIQGISTESEAGLEDINRLIRFIVERRIPAVFVETSVADRNVRALVDGAQASGHQLTIGGTLFSDAMGPAGAYEGTYLGMIDHNVTTIARALGGDAPAGGWQGLLGQPAAAATDPSQESAP